ncbi:MAG: hypothetical protein JHD35_17800 [Sphingopyxis sp.]|nr:hypothetical protein [Sphingopyxis sp.]
MSDNRVSSVPSWLQLPRFILIMSALALTLGFLAYVSGFLRGIETGDTASGLADEDTALINANADNSIVISEIPNPASYSQMKTPDHEIR